MVSVLLHGDVVEKFLDEDVEEIRGMLDEDDEEFLGILDEDVDEYEEILEFPTPLTHGVIFAVFTFFGIITCIVFLIILRGDLLFTLLLYTKLGSINSLSFILFLFFKVSVAASAAVVARILEIIPMIHHTGEVYSSKHNLLIKITCQTLCNFMHV